MYKVIIAVDEIRAIEVMSKLMKSFPNYHVVKAVSDACSIIPAVIEYQPDLLLLDINLGQKSGIDIANDINSINNKVQIIFVTAHYKFAMDAFECMACDYLLKPVSLLRLSKALSHFEDIFNGIRNQTEQVAGNEVLRFNTQKGYVLIKHSDIVYLEADEVYTQIHTTENRTHHVSQNIGKIEPKLDASKFIRVSRSGIVNKEFISEIIRTEKRCILRWNGSTHEVKVTKLGIERLESVFGN